MQSRKNHEKSSKAPKEVCVSIQEFFYIKYIFFYLSYQGWTKIYIEHLLSFRIFI